MSFQDHFPRRISRAAPVAAGLAAVWFDFFLTVPYERFTITRHTDPQLLIGQVCDQLTGSCSPPAPGPARAWSSGWSPSAWLTRPGPRWPAPA
jgi:hypothetical protein